MKHLHYAVTRNLGMFALIKNSKGQYPACLILYNICLSKLSELYREPVRDKTSGRKSRHFEKARHITDIDVFAYLQDCPLIHAY